VNRLEVVYRDQGRFFRNHRSFAAVIQPSPSKGNDDETDNNRTRNGFCALGYIRICTERIFRRLRWRKRRRLGGRRHDDRLLGGRDDGQLRHERHHGISEQHGEPLGQHARSERLAERLNTDADRPGFGHEKVEARGRPRICAGLFFALFFCE
jgi:hypothetical protein